MKFVADQVVVEGFEFVECELELMGQKGLMELSVVLVAMMKILFYLRQEHEVSLHELVRQLELKSLSLRSQHFLANHMFVARDCTSAHLCSSLTKLHRKRRHNTGCNRLDVESIRTLPDN